MERVKLSKIKENKKNPRLIRDTQFNKLVKSLLVFPRMLELRPIVVDATGTVLGGNMRLKALKHIVKLPAQNIADIVATDKRFSEEQRKAICEYWAAWQKQKDAPIVKADDLTEEQKREFIIKDNSGFGEWDFNALGNEWSDLPLTEWSVPAWDTEEEKTEEESTEENYERKIVAPVYEPSDENVTLEECYDTRKVNNLIDEIEKADVPSDTKDFLRIAAYRHTRFNYEKIADIYAKSLPEVQRLMEMSALVIIDIDKAIEDGYVRMTKDFLDEFGRENDGEE